MSPTFRGVPVSDEALKMLAEYEAEVRELRHLKALLAEGGVRDGEAPADTLARTIRERVAALEENARFVSSQGRTIRRRMPDERPGKTRKFEIPWPENDPPVLSIFLTASIYPDGSPGEVFIKCDRVGSLASGALNALAIAISVGLQYGVPIDAFTDKFVGMKFAPDGLTGDSKYKLVASVVDVVGRYLRDEFVPAGKGS